MFSFNFYDKHRQTAIKITYFLIVVILISVIIGYFFPNINKRIRNGAEDANDIKNNEAQYKEQLKIAHSNFLYHFAILDSAAIMPPQDTMYHCCYGSISFMEQYTGIVADVEGDYSGATGFKKSDLENWHNWYDSIKSLPK